MSPLAGSGRTPLLVVLAAVIGVLVVAGAVARVLHARVDHRHAAALSNLDARIRSWWVIVTLVTGSLCLGAAGVLVLFAAVSALALHELARHAPHAVRDPRLDAASYALVALQYGLVAWGDPLPALLLLPAMAAIVLLLTAATPFGAALRRRVVHRVGWVIIAGWCLSFVPGVLMLDRDGDRVLLLVVYVIVVTQGSDVLQYVFGKLLGRRRIAPRLSPDKTVAGFVGGIACSALIGTALWSLTPFTPRIAAAVSLLIALLGFAGGLLLSGLKRRLGIKDWGNVIDGHGGVLDRVDSLYLPAPALFLLAYAVMPG